MKPDLQLKQRTPTGRDTKNFFTRLKYFMTPIDGRYEDLFHEKWYLSVLRDFTAGLIVAMVAIPLAMGFAMASGLRPEQGIVGGAVAGLLGALFGGSKYQVYGPTAAFIPVIGGIMAAYNFQFLVLASVVAGLILMLMGLSRLGRLSALVPHSIVVGFTIGIAIVIALSQIGEILGLRAKLGYSFFEKVQGIWTNLGEVSIYAIIIGLATFAITKLLLKISFYLPAPLIALGLATVLSSTIWKDKGLTLVKDKYGSIPTDFWVFTPPAWMPFDGKMLWDFSYYVVAIVFVAAIESLLCSRMADRLAGNKGLPFDPNKELWGQGLVNMIVPMLNGFPHTGALARTATNIRLGAVSPLAGIFKCFLKLLLALYLASFLESVPMACIGGILLYVAVGMVKPAEVREVIAHNKLHIGLMIYTAAMVVFTDFLTGVLTAIIIYALLYRFLDKPQPASAPEPEILPAK
ncbi:MAG TPA: SulP family inorganic anion transporter [Blastocatellia bacterium]|nr:SulP family inorganic anion transporter [Blastocatellia bacterium]